MRAASSGCGFLLAALAAAGCGRATPWCTPEILQPGVADDPVLLDAPRLSLEALFSLEPFDGCGLEPVPVDVELMDPADQRVETVELAARPTGRGAEVSVHFDS